MEVLGNLWKRVILLGVILVTVLVDDKEFVDSAAASEWSLGPTEEYTTAFINLTYMEADKLHTEKSDVSFYKI